MFYPTGLCVQTSQLIYRAHLPAIKPLWWREWRSLPYVLFILWYLTVIFGGFCSLIVWLWNKWRSAASWMRQLNLTVFLLKNIIPWPEGCHSVKKLCWITKKPSMGSLKQDFEFGTGLSFVINYNIHDAYKMYCSNIIKPKLIISNSTQLLENYLLKCLQYI